MVRFFNVDDDNIMYGTSGADPAKFKGGGGVHTAMIQTSQKRLGGGGGGGGGGEGGGGGGGGGLQTVQ